MKGIWAVLVKNKKNGQINISIPKKKIPAKTCEELLKSERIKFLIEGFEKK